MTQLFTDGSNDPGSQKTGVAVVVTQNELFLFIKRTDLVYLYLQLYLQLVAIVMALQWVEEE